MLRILWHAALVASLLVSAESFFSSSTSTTGILFRNSKSYVLRSELTVHQLQSSNVYYTPKPNYALVDKTEHDGVTIASYRLLALSALGVICTNQAGVNQQLALVWAFLQQQWWFRHDMWEPFVAVVGFYVAVHAFAAVDWLSSKGLVPGLSKFHLPSQKAAAEGRSFAGVTKWYSGWAQEMAIYVLPLWALSSFTEIFAPRRKALELAAPTVWRILREIMGGLFFYDLFFFFTHVPLHKAPPRLYALLHGKHHSSPEVRSCDTVRLTPMEQTIDTICSIAGLRIMGAHPMSRSLYNLVITFLLTELHCGFDFAWSPQNLVPFNLMAGSRRHHEHHRGGKRFYQKFFTYLDELTGFGASPGILAGQSQKQLLAV